MKHIAIMGLGLMGGSLGLALKRCGHLRVSAFARRDETRRLALEAGAVDEVFGTPHPALRGADIAVFCTPVLTIPALVAECQQAFEKGCVVTDVGSTKTELVRQMAPFVYANGMQFVGSHPMAGSEKIGMECARADLYEGAVTVITPLPGTPPDATETVADLWGRVGARVVRMDPEEHDRLVARTSHLPHLMAALLVATAGREITPQLKSLIGPGFRDATRIAGGAPDMWHDIIKSNQGFILNELHAYDQALRDLIQLIEAKDFSGVKHLLDAKSRLRKELLG